MKSENLLSKLNPIQLNAKSYLNKVGIQMIANHKSDKILSVDKFKQTEEAQKQENRKTFIFVIITIRSLTVQFIIFEMSFRFLTVQFIISETSFIDLLQVIFQLLIIHSIFQISLVYTNFQRKKLILFKNINLLTISKSINLTLQHTIPSRIASQEYLQLHLMQQDFEDSNAQQTHNKIGHLHYDYDDQQENLTPQPKTYDNTYQEKPQLQLENIIMEKIKTHQKEEDLISRELEIKLQKLIEKIIFSHSNEEEKLKLRMHQLALSKILVNTHAKTQFYLVRAHHHLGEAYLNYKCYEQALDHLTTSLKKNAKINQMSEIKLYHSYVLTTYSRCYYEISSYEDALQILKKAHDIQLGCQTQNNKIDNVQTLKLISNCYLKLKNYSSSLQFVQKVIGIFQIKKGKKSKQYAKTQIQKAKILICEENNQKLAIQVLQSAIKILNQIKYQNQLQIADYYELLSTFYEKIKDYPKQIQNLYKKQQIYSQKFQEGHQKTLKIKKNIALLLQKHNRNAEAIKQLEEILEYEQKFYPQNRVQIGKTLKALGMSYMVTDQRLNEAEQFFKRAQKLLAQHGIPKSIKQIKNKLLQIKEIKQNKLGQKQQLKIVEREIKQQPIGMAH